MTRRGGGGPGGPPRPDGLGDSYCRFVSKEFGVLKSCVDGGGTHCCVVCGGRVVGCQTGSEGGFQEVLVRSTDAED